ncbi:hypothetical protein [Methylomonas sp. CM2]|uniref:hypothetical protein n=1 Tax=Methylomonas sp. CM2 TaxID=3417647 RepID=UPI003CF2AF0C
MTVQMTNPMDGLVFFQKALEGGHIAPQKGSIHSDLLMLRDSLNGEARLTYALIKNRKVVATTTFIPVDPIDGHMCFNTGYAVDFSDRSKGYGKEVTQKAFDELVNGFKRAGIPHLYVEALVSTKNEHSNKLACRLFSASPRACTDEVSGQPAFYYVRQLF